MNRLTILRPAIEGKTEFLIYRCACGNEKALAARSVRNGRVKSCGCLNNELRQQRNIKHGLTYRNAETPDIYWLWCAMKQRCENTKNISYPYYGGVGTSVCSRWKDSFVLFRKDMGPRPSKAHSIDRINPFGNYEPGNCRWATPAEQMRNMRINTPYCEPLARY